MNKKPLARKSRPTEPRERGNVAVRLMEHLAVPTFVLDVEGRVMIWNRACERLTGLRAKDVLGTRDHWQAFYDKPRPCLADLLLRKQMRDATALYVAHSDIENTSHGLAAENWCIMPHVGRRLYLAIDAGLIFDDAGAIIAVIESLRDLTMQKTAETALNELASRDGLTGAGNRRYFDLQFATEWRLATLSGRPLSLLMLDVDHFKRYNDDHGHQHGDSCLRRIASTIKAQLERPEDIVARYGGEEFAVILPETDAIAAFAVAERIRAAVENLDYEGIRAEISVSVGVATWAPSTSDDRDRLVSRADYALYGAKRSGRNRVLSYDEVVVGVDGPNVGTMRVDRLAS